MEDLSWHELDFLTRHVSRGVKRERSRVKRENLEFVFFGDNNDFHLKRNNRGKRGLLFMRYDPNILTQSWKGNV